jgi:hypothetical protein
LSLRAHLLSAAALTILAASALAAHADTIFTSVSAFDAASSGLTTVTFDGIAPAGGFANEGTSFNIGGASFSSSTYFNVNDAAYYPDTYPGSGIPTYNSGGYLLSAAGVLTISFAPSTAVSIDAGGLFGPVSIPITLSDGLTTTLVAPDSITGTGALDFIGFTSSTPITSITLDFPAGPNDDAVDNVSYGTAVTPEPSTFVFLGTGLLGLAGAARRKFIC